MLCFSLSFQFGNFVIFGTNPLIGNVNRLIGNVNVIFPVNEGIIPTGNMPSFPATVISGVGLIFQFLTGLLVTIVETIVVFGGQCESNS